MGSLNWHFQDFFQISKQDFAAVEEDEASSLRSAYRRQLLLIASLRRQLSDLDLGNGDDDEELRELEVIKRDGEIERYSSS